MTMGEAIGWARGWLGLPRRNRSTARTELEGSSDEVEETASASDEPEKGQTVDRAKKVAGIVSSTIAITGTPGELYLRKRGITATPPECIRFRRGAFGRFGQYGALVALASDAEGKVLAVQQVYVTNDGEKAPVAVGKRTNKAADDWIERSAVRLPGTLPVILAEGPETALSIWQATGRETWACLGISNIGRAPVPAGAPVVIARDGDEAGSKADRQIAKAAASLATRGHSVFMATPPQGDDFNDILMKRGPDVVCKLIDEAQPIRRDAIDRSLDIGSDVEIARRVRNDLMEQFGAIVHSEGAIWRYRSTHWEPIPDHELRRAVHLYDGASYFTPSGSPACVSLGKTRINSVLNECGTLCADPDFFENRPTGINCASGFIRFATDGSPTIEPHNRDHRCRHTLPGRWQIGTSSCLPQDSLLRQLLNGVFQDDMAYFRTIWRISGR
jgi:phage/plasmid primase-like uncharacterized protein